MNKYRISYIHYDYSAEAGETKIATTEDVLADYFSLSPTGGVVFSQENRAVLYIEDCARVELVKE